MIELWLVLALAAAGVQTAYNVIQKRLTVDYSGLQLSYVTSALGFAFMLPIGLWSVSQGSVQTTPAVAGAVAVSGIANIGAIYAFLTALRRADLSVVAPLQQLSPIVVALVEPLVLTVGFDIEIVAGAVVATAGAYVVMLDGRDPRVPLRRVTEVPILLSLSAALLFSASSLADRYATTRMPPLFYTLLIYTIMFGGLGTLARSRDQLVPARKLLAGVLLALGISTALRTSLSFMAFSLASASQVLVALRASILLNVLAGGALFGERNVPIKLVGAALVAAGIVLVV